MTKTNLYIKVINNQKPKIMYVECEVEEFSGWVKIKDLWKKEVEVTTIAGGKMTVTTSSVKVATSMFDCNYEGFEALYFPSSNEVRQLNTQHTIYASEEKMKSIEFFNTISEDQTMVEIDKEIGRIKLFETPENKIKTEARKKVKKRKMIPYLSFYVSYLKDRVILLN